MAKKSSARPPIAGSSKMGEPYPSYFDDIVNTSFSQLSYFIIWLPMFRLSAATLLDLLEYSSALLLLLQIPYYLLCFCVFQSDGIKGID